MRNELFINGPITSTFIAEVIASQNKATGTGAHQIFLGQVRRDEIEGKHVQSIDFTAYIELAADRMRVIQEEIFAAYPISCLQVYHSIGLIEAGEICLFVFTSSAHRKAATDASSAVVERIKKELPIWGKEIFDYNNHQWKVNKL